MLGTKYSSSGVEEVSVWHSKTIILKGVFYSAKLWRVLLSSPDSFLAVVFTEMVKLNLNIEIFKLLLLARQIEKNTEKLLTVFKKLLLPFQIDFLQEWINHSKKWNIYKHWQPIKIQSYSLPRFHDFGWTFSSSISRTARFNKGQEVINSNLTDI